MVAKRSEKEPDIKLSINYFSQMAFGYIDINKILFLENIDITKNNENAIRLLQTIFTKKQNYINEYV